jgi:hypothetical protein
MIGVMGKRKIWTPKHTGEDGHVKMEAEIGVCCPTSRNSWGHQALEEMRILPLEDSEGA